MLNNNYMAPQLISFYIYIYIYSRNATSLEAPPTIKLHFPDASRIHTDLLKASIYVML